MHTRALLAAGHDLLLEPPFEPDEYQEALDGLEQAIDILDAVITPTEEALSNFFVDDWVLDVVDGECHVRYRPLREDERFSA